MVWRLPRSFDGAGNLSIQSISSVRNPVRDVCRCPAIFPPMSHRRSRPRRSLPALAIFRSTLYRRSKLRHGLMVPVISLRSPRKARSHIRSRRQFAGTGTSLPIPSNINSPRQHLPAVAIFQSLMRLSNMARHDLLAIERYFDQYDIATASIRHLCRSRVHACSRHGRTRTATGNANRNFGRNNYTT